METYGENILMLSLAGFFISIIAYAIIQKYAWMFGCIAGFCFFTVFCHISVLLGYEDITDPSYEVYKNWNIYRFILSDITRLFIWVGIGMLYYIAFIKRNKSLKSLLILGAGVFSILMVLLMGVSSIRIA